jgi:alpha-amylase
MYPSDLEVIFGRTKKLDTSFGFKPQSDAFVYQEVIDNGNEAVSKYEYTFATVTEFRYSTEIGRSFSGRDDLKWLSGFGEKWDLLPSDLAVIFIDNHDSQRSGNDDVLTYKKPKNYIMAQAFSLAHPYGNKRIMSSYAFKNRDVGPPADKQGNILSPQYDRYGNCINTGWICEHRWPQIAAMVQFNLVVGNQPVTNWFDNGRNQIAFSRGNRGFIVFNLDTEDMIDVIITTSMPEGHYCDIITGRKVSNSECSGLTIDVFRDQTITINLNNDDINGVIAIHVDQQIYN